MGIVLYWKWFSFHGGFVLRKKSHISLALYLADSINFNDIANHKLSFCIGSILPDCKPSFLTTRHEITATFDKVKEDIKKLIYDYKEGNQNSSSFIRNLGQVIHYLADYFTYPHNLIYPGTLKDHCVYENELKFALRDYIKSGEALKSKEKVRTFTTVESLFDFIQKTHSEYLNIKQSVKDDCKYIVSLCHHVVEGILHLFYLQNKGFLVPAMA